MDLKVLESLERFVERAGRPGVLGLPGRKVEKQATADLSAYFKALLPLLDREDLASVQTAEAARVKIQAVLRRKRDLLQAVLELNLEKAFLTAAALEYRLQESVDDEPRDEQGRWTDGGGGSLFADEKGKTSTKLVFHQDKIDFTDHELDTYQDGTTKSVVNIDIDKLHPSQDVVKNGAVLRYMKDPSRINLPAVYEVEPGKYAIMDGHHGIAAAQANGAKTAKVNLFSKYKLKEADDQPWPIDQLGDSGKAASDYAKQHAADLVTAIDKTTEDLLVNAISQGIDSLLGAAGTGRLIRQSVTDMSVYRAAMIASTEINRAMSSAAIDKLGALEQTYKQIILSPDACPICQANAEEDPVPLDHVYDSGDSEPPFHPNCRCAIAAAAPPDDES